MDRLITSCNYPEKLVKAQNKNILGQEKQAL
jgi:hypothetical protein